MNKSVLITNIQKIITNIEQTIEDLSSILGKDNFSYKSKIEKSIDLLKVKIDDEDSYKIDSTEYRNLNLLIKKIQSEKLTLKKLINDTEFNLYCLNIEIEQKKSLESSEQREYEILADSLNISENDEEIYKIMKEKEKEIRSLHNSINDLLREIEDRKKTIDRYNEEIEIIDLKESSHRKNLDVLNSYIIDEVSRTKDINQYNILSKMFSTINSIEQLKDIILSLQQLIEYLGKREADIEYVNEEILKVKSYIAKLNGNILEYLAIVDLENLFKEKELLISKLNENNLINEQEVKERELEINGLEFEVSYYQSECVNDELNLIDYTHRVERINDSIDKINLQNKMLQKEVNELNLKMLYFINDNFNNENEEISKLIRKKQRKIENNKKSIEKLIKIKVDIENIIRNIKKSKKNFETMKGDMKSTLNDIKDFNNETISKYDLNSYRKQILMLDLIIQFTKIVDGIIHQNYLKKLDDISVESLEPYIGVIGFYKYEKPAELIDAHFIEKVKDSMEKMISYGSMGIQNDHFIKNLNYQGVKVIKFGKALQSMGNEELQSEKLVKLGEYHE